MAANATGSWRIIASANEVMRSPRSLLCCCFGDELRNSRLLHSSNFFFCYSPLSFAFFGPLLNGGSCETFVPFGTFFVFFCFLYITPSGANWISISRTNAALQARATEKYLKDFSTLSSGAEPRTKRTNERSKERKNWTLESRTHEMGKLEREVI